MSVDLFKDYLKVKNLSDRYIYELTYYYKKFMPYFESKKEGEDDREVITKFLLRYPNKVARAFLLNFSEWLDINIKIPKLTGRKERKLRKSITQEDLKLIRKVMYEYNEVLGIALDLSYYCALRRAELIGIYFKDFHWDAFKENSSMPCKLTIRGKGRKERIVVVPNFLMVKIIKYINNNNDKIVLKNNKLIYFQRSVWQDKFHEVIKKLGMSYTLHDLRRTKATDWYAEGLDLFQIKNRLGHSSIATTQIYINESEEKEINHWFKELAIAKNN